jgi:hypothetical protein
MRVVLHFCFAFLLLLQAPAFAKQLPAPVDPAWEKLAFSIEDSRTFVGIAPVYLSVSELKPEGGNLVGTYKIDVPLMTSKNDHGKIILPLKAKVSDLGEKGGVLKGKAHSEAEEGTVNDIVCVIIPEKDQAIQLAITTDKRTVKFTSRYTVIETSQDG